MVRTTLSDGRESFGVEIEVDEDEEISVGDMFEHDEITWMVTRIDNEESRPEKILGASDIFSMWATRSTRKLSLSIARADPSDCLSKQKTWTMKKRRCSRLSSKIV